jgi:DNA-binding PadR family transcriptional regulator
MRLFATELEIHIMIRLCNQEDYGYVLEEWLRARGLAVRASSMYRTLELMRLDGLLILREETTGKGDGSSYRPRVRQYYRLSPSGAGRLRVTVDRLRVSIDELAGAPQRGVVK